MELHPTIEAMFSDLLESSSRMYSVREKDEILHFVNVAEYGLALETAVDICVEESKEPTSDFSKKVANLASIMKMDVESIISKLSVKP